MRNNRAGFTLVEILIATMILATGIMVLLTRSWQAAPDDDPLQTVPGDAVHLYAGGPQVPDRSHQRVENDIPVTAISAVELVENPSQQMLEILERYTFRRTVDEGELETNQVDDGLFIDAQIRLLGTGRG